MTATVYTHEYCGPPWPWVRLTTGDGDEDGSCPARAADLRPWSYPTAWDLREHGTYICRTTSEAEAVAWVAEGVLPRGVW